MKRVLALAVALAFTAIVFQPTSAEAQWRRGGAVAAGAIVGLAGGLILGSALSSSAYAAPHYYYEPEYYAPAPVYVAPRPRVVVASPNYDYYDAPVVVQRRCWVERRPLFDEWGRRVASRNVRVCR
jgi:hypothetical protein